MEPLYLDCSCGSEVLRIQYDEDIESYDVAIFTLQLGDMSWMDKFRYIWQVLTTGEPYGDRMVVKSDEMDKITEYIDSVNKP